MEENKRSGEQAEERTAREGRAMKWLVAEVTPRDIGAQITWQFTDEETAELLADYAQAECSRLASRNEQLAKEANSYAEVISYISEIVNGTPECHYLVIGDDVQRMRDRLASRVEELENLIAKHSGCSHCVDSASGGIDK